MTFLPELKRLMDAATKGEWMWDGNQLWHLGSGYRDDDVDPHRYTGINYDRRLDKSPTLHANKDLIAYLVNHAPALAELVETVELLDGSPSDVELAKVLCRRIRAKLNGGKHE